MSPLGFKADVCLLSTSGSLFPLLAFDVDLMENFNFLCQAQKAKKIICRRHLLTLTCLTMR